MTEEELQQYLEDSGAPPHVVAAGSQGLFRRYREFVAEVEKGYEYSLQDYRRDLDGRAIIHLIEADSEVAEADERLAGMLTECDVRVWESAPGDPFWDFGFPRNARGWLLRGLKSEGLISE